MSRLNCFHVNARDVPDVFAPWFLPPLAVASWKYKLHLSSQRINDTMVPLEDNDNPDNDRIWDKLGEYGFEDEEADRHKKDKDGQDKDMDKQTPNDRRPPTFIILLQLGKGRAHTLGLVIWWLKASVLGTETDFWELQLEELRWWGLGKPLHWMMWEPLSGTSRC